MMMLTSRHYILLCILWLCQYPNVPHQNEETRTSNNNRCPATAAHAFVTSYSIGPHHNSGTLHGNIRPNSSDGRLRPSNPHSPRQSSCGIPLRQRVVLWTKQSWAVQNKVSTDGWFPHSLLCLGPDGSNHNIYEPQGDNRDDDRAGQGSLERERLEEESLQLMVDLLRPHLAPMSRDGGTKDDAATNKDSAGLPVAEDRDDGNSRQQHEDESRPSDRPSCNTSSSSSGRRTAYELAKGRFVDLCCTFEGEQKLESLFLDDRLIDPSSIDERVVRGAILSLQSLLILGTSYGNAVNPEVLERSVSHMREPMDDVEAARDSLGWTPESTRRLKFVRTNDGTSLSSQYNWKIAAGQQLLAKLGRKRSAVGAFDLLVRLGVWEKHENLPLLRSGFPLRFTEEEEKWASDAASIERDPDTILGIRQDYRHQKLYTIDGASASEIDDALGVEILDSPSSSGVDTGRRYRYWIHIADADRWAPRNSDLFQVARKRATSIYLPNGAVPMMPSRISKDVMSLKANKDTCALSLGVELADDGSIVDSSIIVAPSQVRVSYRLTYDEVDEMLEDGLGYQEEWELGQLYAAAQTRRRLRTGNGSSESFVPTQIPQYSVSVFPDPKSPDDIGIRIRIEVSHNGGKNQSAVVAETQAEQTTKLLSNELPASSASTLVTEMMILAGEAIGKWALYQEKNFDDASNELGSKKQVAKNILSLPFRGQQKPDYRARERERKIMMDLLEYNIGGGYCHAWYARRFLPPVDVKQTVMAHSGLGLDCYVQWTSPIRRFQDLQVHSAVKRYLRRQKLIEIMAEGSPIPPGINADDIGCEPTGLKDDAALQSDEDELVDQDIDYNDRTKMLGPARYVMKASNKYWLLEYIRRLYEANAVTTFEALVLGCVNPANRQYAIYVYELGLEWRYTSPVSIQAGNTFKLRIASVIPQNGQLTFVRVQ